MRLHRVLTATLAALGLSACELEPGDPVYLSGRALEADGSPWRSGALPLLRQLPYEAAADGGTLGPQGLPPFGPWRSVEVDAQGRFLQRLTARDLGVRSSDSYVDTLFQLQLPPPGDGSQQLLTFRPSRDAELPPLRRWDSALMQAPAPGGVQLRWAPAVADEDLAPHTYEVQVHAGQALAWRVDVTGAGTGAHTVLLEPELLEDFAAPEVHVSAVTFGQRRWMSSSLDYELRHHSPRLPLVLAGRVPESRGVPCVVNGVPQQPCPFTDGSLERAHGSTANVATGELVLQLRAPLRPGRVLVRGLETFGWNQVLQVDGAEAEGAPWQQLGRSARSEHVFQPVGNYSGLETRYVDLRLEGAPAVTRLRLQLLFQNDPYEPPPGQPPPPAEFAQPIDVLREVSVFAAAP